MVVLNFQTPDLAMQLNQGKCEYNGIFTKDCIEIGADFSREAGQSVHFWAAIFHIQSIIIAIYYYYLSWELILIYRPREVARLTVVHTYTSTSTSPSACSFVRVASDSCS